MTRVLVTGAGGYIGSVLVGLLLGGGYSVTALDRFFFGDEPLNPHARNPALRIVRQDIRDVDERLLEGIDVVCDLAALSNDPAGDLDPELTLAVNWRGRGRLAALAARQGVKRYLLSSSCSVYGRGAGDVLSEATAVAPLSIYAECNARAEREALACAREGLSVTILRNPTAYGLSPRMRFDLAVNLMTLNATRDTRIYVTGGGRQWRPLAHVRDVARAFLCVIEGPRDAVAGEVFNVGGENVQIRALAYLIRESLPFPLEINIVPDDCDKRDYRVSFDKIRERLGFTPELRVQDGAREIYDALKNGTIDDGPRTSTVTWYRTLLDAKRLVAGVELNGRLL